MKNILNVLRDTPLDDIEQNVKNIIPYGIPVLGILFCLFVVILAPLRSLIISCAETFLVHRQLNSAIWEFKLISFAFQGIFAFGIILALIYYVKKSASLLSIFIAVMSLLFTAYLFLFLNNPLGHQRNLLFLGAEDLFADCLNVYRYVQNRDPYFNDITGLKEHAYPPFAYLILYPFSQIHTFINNEYFESLWNSKILIFYSALVTALEMIFLAEALKKVCKVNGITTLILLAFSGWFIMTYERGNIIILSIACAVLFLCWYNSENKNERIAALLCLAIAAGLKGYPAVYGFLYFEKKQYKEIIVSACITLALIFIPFLFFRGGYKNITQWVNNTREFNLLYGPMSGYSLRSGNSIFFICLKTRKMAMK
jgi:hypothetical protein